MRTNTYLPAHLTGAQRRQPLSRSRQVCRDLGG